MTGPAPARWAVVAAGTGLLLVVLAFVIRWHYLQIGWHVSTPVPVIWWFAGDLAATLGGPLFFAAAGILLGQLGDRPLTDVLLTRVLPGLSWYTLSVSAGAAVVLRFGPAYGLAPIRDTTEFLEYVVLPPPGLSPAYALALFPLLAWIARRMPTPLVLGLTATAAVLLAAVAVRLPHLVTSADLAGNLLFFVLGWRLHGVLDRFATAASPARSVLAGAVFAAVAGAFVPAGEAADWLRPIVVGLAALPCAVAAAALIAARPTIARPVAEPGRAAAPIAAALLPVAGLVSAVLLKRLSALDGPAQLLVAAVEPALVAAAIATGGVIVYRLSSRIVAPKPAQVGE